MGQACLSGTLKGETRQMDRCSKKHCRASEKQGLTQSRPVSHRHCASTAPHVYCAGGHVEWRFQRRWRQLVGHALGFVVVSANMARAALVALVEHFSRWPDPGSWLRPEYGQPESAAVVAPRHRRSVWICIKLLTCICIAHRTLRIDSMHYNAAVCIHSPSNNASITLQHAEDNVTWITLGQKSKLFQQADQSQAGRANRPSQKNAHEESGHLHRATVGSVVWPPGSGHLCRGSADTITKEVASMEVAAMPP